MEISELNFFTANTVLFYLSLSGGHGFSLSILKYEHASLFLIWGTEN